MEDFLKLEEFLSEEQILIRDTVREFVNSQVIPKMADAFENGYLPSELIKGCANLNLLGLTLPEKFGGQDLDYITYGLVCQEIERGDSGLRSFASVQSSLCMYPIFRYGSEEHRIKYLHKLANAEIIGCFGLTEPDSGSDPGSMRTTAKKTTNGWILNGAKTWITNAPIADIAIVWAKTEDGVRGFIVDRDTPGFATKEIKHKMSLRASNTGELLFSDCEIPDNQMLPGSTRGLGAPLSCLTQARYGISWGVTGAATACFEAAKNYAMERKQFGRSIASFQLIQADLTSMFTSIVRSQVFNLRLGQLMSEGKATPEMVSMGKMASCREALSIARKARNILGGNGISLEYPVIRHMMNLEAVFTYEGTDNIHTLILGKHLTGENAFN